MKRRHFLASTGLLTGGAPAQAQGAPIGDGQDHGSFADPKPLVPLQARADRIIHIAVCTRPFRALGPRIQAQRLGRQVVVHNYGHGGSGWSLSWGSAQQAVALALQAHKPHQRDRRMAVIGCGAIGLTSAIVAQRAGFQVRILCRDRPPDVPSASATGVWSPASRICTQEHATPAFEQQWQAMARHSFHQFQNLLGLAGDPVEWTDGYLLSDTPFNQSGAADDDHGHEPDYPYLQRLIPELRPRSQTLQPHEHPFAVPHARRYAQLLFNLPSYTELLLTRFHRNGGTIETRHFESPREWAGLPERSLINATGYGARALMQDHTITPVRGQTARLMPQPGAHYGIRWRGHNLSVVPRRDGTLVQAQDEHDFGNADLTPDRDASVAAVQRLAQLFPA